VAALLTERTVLGVIATLAVLVSFLVLCKTRRSSSSVDDATLAALQRISKATPDLRAGLTEEAANRATPHLRELLRCVAVGITNPEGELLSWDGEANEHYEDLDESISRSLSTFRREHVDHDKLGCQRRGNCPMRTAVIVPLVVEGSVEGALVVVGGVASKRLIKMADEIARFVRTQLELAKLDESRQALAQAEVRALRAQISPHFVYNALNTIASLIRTDPERARELLMEFAEFTRYSFRTNGLFTTLADELRNIDRYLTLESARYGPNRLHIRLKIAPEVLGVTVPFLVLQPLVENAVRHGLAKKPGGGTVTVIAQDHGTEALISVEDDGVGMDADRLETLRDAHRSGAHVGIGNINQRMRSVYGEEYALMVETAPGAGMKVVLRVPKFSPNVRAVMPAYSGGAEELTDITERVVEQTGSTPVVRPAHARPTSTELPAVG
jgi:two-component system LytT family sensor kinase